MVEEFLKLIEKNKKTREDYAEIKRLLRGRDGRALLETPDLRGMGRTPLYTACLNADSQLAEMLLWFGADPHKKNPSSNHSPASVVQSNPNCAKIDRLIKTSYNEPALIHPMRLLELAFISADRFQFVSGSRLTVNTPLADNTAGNNLLHLACYQGDLELVKELVQGGADVNRKNKLNKSPLDIIEATSLNLSKQQQKERMEIAGILIQKGADIGSRDVSKYPDLAVKMASVKPVIVNENHR